MDASAHFKGKKITVMGLGLLGRGVGDIRYLAECGADLIVTDLKTEEELASSLALLSQFPDISYTLGKHDLKDFEGRDLILKAAGVPFDSLHIAYAKSKGISVRMSADLFAEYSGVPLIGVTGTRGKSTVTHMIYSALVSSGKKVHLGGNVRGVSTLALLKDVEPNDMAVLELDSWQCQGFGEAHMSPHVAVFTTFMSDHMNYYKDNMDAYLLDKAQIFLHQTPGDILVAGTEVAALLKEKYEGKMHGALIVPQTLPEDWKLKVPGEHNRFNASLARAALLASGMDDASIRTALEGFVALSGRIELVREVNGVAIYNDTNATTPEASVAALRALDPEGKKNIVLITGGADKGLDMCAYIREISERTKRVIMLSGTGTSRILPQLRDVSVYDSLATAFEEAMRTAYEGDIVLLSPAFASFGMFKNEYDRGDQFTALVHAL